MLAVPLPSNLRLIQPNYPALITRGRGSGARARGAGGQGPGVTDHRLRPNATIEGFQPLQQVPDQLYEQDDTSQGPAGSSRDLEGLAGTWRV